MLSKNKAKEMKRRTSQRRATHMARQAALTAAAKAERGKMQSRSKGHVKSTAEATKPEKVTPKALPAAGA